MRRGSGYNLGPGIAAQKGKDCCPLPHYHCNVSLYDTVMGMAIRSYRDKITAAVSEGECPKGFPTQGGPPQACNDRRREGIDRLKESAGQQAASARA